MHRLGAELKHRQPTGHECSGQGNRKSLVRVYSRTCSSSDQGVQYASHDYVDCLKKHSILISMSRKGNPYDNAFAESFIKTLKVEEVYLNEYETFEDAYGNIWRFIEKVYNQKRLHSALDYRSPERFEMEIALNTVA